MEKCKFINVTAGGPLSEWSFHGDAVFSVTYEIKFTHCLSEM